MLNNKVKQICQCLMLTKYFVGIIYSLGARCTVQTCLCVIQAFYLVCHTAMSALSVNFKC